MKRVLIPFRHEKKVRPYQEAARQAGLDPVAGHVSGELSLAGVAGLLLMGGSDVNPALYGEARHPETDEPDDERDSIELRLLAQADEQDLPVLAICRGLQILNVSRGGTLVQHLSETWGHDPEKDDHSGRAHDVAFVPGSRLARIAGAKQWPVNSRHHQAVGSLGEGLSVSARALEQDIVEGVERIDRRFVVAVQWHPEDQVQRYPEQLRLFEEFAAAL
jgi:putative glutamine amidotransferase